MSRTTLPVTVAAFLAAFALAAPSALATDTISSPNGTTTITGDAGSDEVFVQFVEDPSSAGAPSSCQNPSAPCDSFLVTSGTVAAGPGCQVEVVVRAVFCPDVDTLAGDLGDGNDELTFASDFVYRTATFSGGSGNDILSGTDTAAAGCGTCAGRRSRCAWSSPTPCTTRRPGRAG